MPAEPLSAAEILAFQLDAGVDIALEDAPQNRFEESLPDETRAPAKAIVAAAPKSIPFIAPAAPVAAPAPPDEAALEAREMALKAESLDALHEILKGFNGCALKKTAKNLVFADGNPKSRVMLVGEAPGADEDREGLPFVGRSGKLLDLMLGAIGLNRTSVYIANIVPWRPPGNRTPTPQETSICLPFIKRQIELANPDILICLGKPSMQTLLNINDGIKAARGKWRNYDTGTRTIKAMATFHPAYLLRSPNEKKFVWRDMLALKKMLSEEI
jgi:uracil-DNA glycosylase